MSNSLDKSNLIKVLLFIAVFLLCRNTYAGRFGAAVQEGYDETLTTALSYGVVINRSAEFGGITVNYAQAIKSEWTWAAALSWDNEREEKNVNEVVRINTFTAIVTAGYLFNDAVDFSFGVGKGFIDDNNKEKQLDFVNGDWSIGGSAGWFIWEKGHRNVSFSTSLEYNVSAQEPSISFDLGYGISF